MPAEQARPPLFVRAPAARAVAAGHEVLVFRTRHQPAQLSQDQAGLLELGVEAVLVLEHDEQALHVVAVLAVNVDEFARHRVSPCFRPRQALTLAKE
ncbi:MAG TPA: hypothetical protein VMU08_09270 [Rhizomicrobium sp.]|nr:hypothetical protein [Rhizomicrobium sp.]